MNRLSVIKYNPCAHRATLLQEDKSDLSTKSSLSGRQNQQLKPGQLVTWVEILQLCV